MSSWFNFSFGPTTFTTGPSPRLWSRPRCSRTTTDLSLNAIIYAQKSKNGSTGFNTEWKVSNDLKVDLDVHHSTAKTSPDSPYGSYGLMDLGMFSQRHGCRLLRPETADLQPGHHQVRSFACN